MLSMLARRRSRPSTTPLRGPAGSIGVPEVSSGIPSPPLSPPLAAIADNTATTKQRPSNVAAARRGGAAFTITEECERLFCETLRTVFLVEGNTTAQDSLVMGLHSTKGHSSDYHLFEGDHISIGGDELHSVAMGQQTLLAPDGFMELRGLVRSWLEVWDSVGGGRFRGFTVENGTERAMFIFFDQEAVAGELKPGLMALLELCSVPAFSCSQLIVCLDRAMPAVERSSLAHDLGWVGFEPVTLVDWTKSDDIISDRWLFLGMEL